MKKIMLMGFIAMIPFFTMAKILPCNTFSYSTNDLAKQLANDKDFKSFNLSLFTFVDKIKTNECAEVFKKIILKTADEQEKDRFLEKMNYNNLEELYSFLKETYSLKLNILQKFPALFQEK